MGEEADGRRVELKKGLYPQRGSTESRGPGMSLVNHGQQEIAFNQSENKWKRMPEHLLFEEMSGTLSIFYPPENSRRNATGISPVISTQ